MSAFESLSVDHAEKIERDAKISKMTDRKEMTLEVKSALDSRAGPADVASFRAALGINAPQKRGPGRPPKEPAQSAAAPDDSRVRHAETIARYTRYFNSPVTNSACNGIAPNPKWSLDEASAHLDRVRATLNSRGAEDTFKHGVVLASKGFEYGTMKLGINPMQLDVTDLGDFIEHSIENDALEPEISEGVAECGSMLITPWYARLSMKLVRLAREYSDLRGKRLHGTQASPSAPADPPKSAKRVRIDAASAEPPSSAASKTRS